MEGSLGYRGLEDVWGLRIALHRPSSPVAVGIPAIMGTIAIIPRVRMIVGGDDDDGWRDHIPWDLRGYGRNHTIGQAYKEHYPYGHHDEPSF
jgi:hypothetical protein